MLRFSSLIVLAIIIMVLIVFSLFYLPKFFYSANVKYTVAMAGRSVMDIWFRYWNLPGVLNKISVYRKWPISYDKYQRDSIYFKYIRVSAPHKDIDKPGVEYGQEMYQSLVEALEYNKYDALFFKFCFVDFGDKSVVTREKAQERFKDMVSLVKTVHELTQEKKMKLLLCNSLPTLKPGIFGQELRYMFNKWVEEYSKEKEGVVKIDLFGILAGNNGRLKKEYSVDIKHSDSHPNMKAFKLLEEYLYPKLQKIAG